ncbi:MAG: magnesium/cobalt transporter CorA [Candidatus Velamenicoccus archaeovorus]
MITCRFYRNGVLEGETPFDPAAMEPARRAGERVWLDVVEPSAEELTQLQEAFGLHELSVEDSYRWGQRSKIEFYADYAFIVAHALALDERGALVDSELHTFGGRGFYLITVRRDPLFDLTGVRSRLKEEPGLVHEGIGFPLYLLLDEIVDGYLDTVERLEDLSDEIEGRVFEDDPGDDRDVQEDIFRLRRTVVRFRRLAAPMREVVDLIQESPGLVTPALNPYYRDVQDHVIRAIEFVDNIRDLLTSAFESRLAQVSNRLNVVMKQVTSWAAIILIPTLIAGIYGMNFRHMPELGTRWGYPMALGVMALSAFLLYRVFRRKGWL